jgi:hypothetical protein
MAYKLGTAWLPGIGRLTGSTPDVPFDGIKGLELKADYREAYTALRTYSVDADKASELALDRLKSTWGVSAAAGNQVMKNPPELSPLYPAINGSKDWIRDEVLNFAAKQIGPQFSKAEMELGGAPVRQWTVEGLISDSRTQAEITGGKPPSYMVSIKKSDGTSQILDKRVAFDPTSQIAEHEAKISAAKPSTCAPRLRDGRSGVLRSRNPHRLIQQPPGHDLPITMAQNCGGVSKVEGRRT